MPWFLTKGASGGLARRAPILAALGLGKPGRGAWGFRRIDGSFHRRRFRRGVGRAARTGRGAKRALDLALAVPALAVLSPLMLVVAAAVRIESPGPALFRQRRMGLGGETFWVLKFRTMAADAEARLGELSGLNESRGEVLIRVRRDPRVTRLGRFLRRTSLDELPQLVNVLRGEMSLVGPRPLQERDCALASAAYPELFAERLKALPGLTGLAQVSGRRALDPLDVLELDRTYVKGRSLGGDLWILARTVPAVLSGRGAL